MVFTGAWSLMEPRGEDKGNGQSWEQLADGCPNSARFSAEGKRQTPLTGGGRRRGAARGWGRVRKEFSHPGFSLSCSPPGRCSSSPHLPDVVQELGRRQAVLWAGELAAVVLEEGQQAWLQVKQPAGGGGRPGVSPGGSPLQAPWALAALQQGEACRAWTVNSSSPSAWLAPLGQLCRWPLLPLPHRGKHVFPRPHREAPP